MSRLLTSNSRLYAATGLLLGILLTLLLFKLVYAEGPEPDALLEEMSWSDRVQLDKNLENYQSLPPARQAQLRQLHEEIQGSKANQQTFQIYCAWLDTLSPWQRKDLASADSANARMKLVRRFLDENQAEEQQRELFNQWKEKEELGRQKLAARLNNIPNDVAEILEPLRKSLELEQNVEQELAVLDQHSQNIRILRIALEQQLKNQSQNKTKADNQPFTPELTREMIRLMSRRDSRSRIEDFPVEAQSFFLMRYLQREMETYSKEVIKKGARPETFELEEVFEKLNEKVKADIGLTNQSRDKFKRLLESYWLNYDLGEIERLLNSLQKRDQRQYRRRPWEGFRNRHPGEGHNGDGPPRRPGPPPAKPPQDGSPPQ
ncbi:MAG: hypothetical protein R3C11_03075 [Planctomycetaceae bacterium]